MMDFIKKAWGSNNSRGFKLAAWGAAFAAFGVWQYMDTKKQAQIEADPLKPHPSFVKKA